MKKIIITIAAACLLLTACSVTINAGGKPEATTTSATTEAPTTSATPTTAVHTTEAPVTINQSDDYQERVDATLKDLFSRLGDGTEEPFYYHSWTDGNLFLTVSVPSFDQFLGDMDEVPDENREGIVDLAHGFVSGDFAKSLYGIVRDVGGEDFDVYIMLGCNDGICCASKNLKIFMDPIGEE